jgi:hypothetical protein
MSAPAYNTVAWFQVGTTDAEQAKGFYGDLFGWRYTLDPNSDGKYHLVSYRGRIRPVVGPSTLAANSRTTRSSWWWSRTSPPSAPRSSGSAGRCWCRPPPARTGWSSPICTTLRATTSACSPRRPRRRPAAPLGTGPSSAHGVPAPARTGVRERANSAGRRPGAEAAASRDPPIMLTRASSDQAAPRPQDAREPALCAAA